MTIEDTTYISTVLQSAEYIAGCSDYVRIELDAIAAFAKTCPRSMDRHWLDYAPFDVRSLDTESRLRFILLFNAISFSYWGEPKWSVHYEGQRLDGAFGLIACLARAYKANAGILNPRMWIQTDVAKVREITAGNVEIPLSAERAAIVRELGRGVLEAGGSAYEMIRRAGGDVLAAIDILMQACPSFRDEAVFKGERVVFQKRVQLAVADVSASSSDGNLKCANLHVLTACADYKLPMVLRDRGILIYDSNLASRVDNKTEIARGSAEEIEIRGNTIWAVELIRRALDRSNVTAQQINDYLWLAGQVVNPRGKPYHRTRTTAY